MNSIQHRSLQEQRAAKLATLCKAGLNPYQRNFSRTHDCQEVRDKFAALEGKAVRIAGRVVAFRAMGKTTFLDLRDETGKLQALCVKEESTEMTQLVLANLDLGDWAEVSGSVCRTRTGEPSVRTKALVLVSKALRPPPLTWDGLEDEETKYRQRYLDLLASEPSRVRFRARFEIIAEIRRFLQERRFLEVETNMLETIAGGAAARPFATRSNALGCEFFLRIAPELRLKRLLVGGFERIFELNRNFRNEGLSRKHNPEFSMIEVYQAGGDFVTMAELVEELICRLAEKFCGGLRLEHRNQKNEITRTIDLRRPWRRANYRDLIREVDAEWFNYSPERRRQRCQELGLSISDAMEDHEVTQQVFEKLIESRTIDPLFVTHLPKELVPLAKQNVEDPSVVDVYELIINGQEISPGYSELNDPLVQRERLESQVGEERQNLDEDFLEALEFGMPPAGGLGMGIDRLVMLLLGAESIRDVILFPQMRPK